MFYRDPAKRIAQRDLNRIGFRLVGEIQDREKDGDIAPCAYVYRKGHPVYSLLQVLQEEGGEAIRMTFYRRGREYRMTATSEVPGKRELRFRWVA